MRNTRSVLLSDEGVRVAVVLLVLSCVLIVTLVLLTSAAGEALVGWFYFTTVNFEDVWAFGPFTSLLECDEHRVATVPREVETTSCVLMNVGEQTMVIGLNGLMNSGKSTVADYLVTHRDFVRLKFSQGLKEMIRALGLSDDEIEGVLKEMPSEKLNGRTPRYAMQTLGTEWGRTHMGQDFWVNLLVQKAHRMEFGTNIVIDDCRFPNEAVAIQRDLQGRVWKLVRGLQPVGVGHASEKEQVYVNTDTVLYNNGTLDDLLEKVEVMLSGEHH